MAEFATRSSGLAWRRILGRIALVAGSLVCAEAIGWMLLILRAPDRVRAGSAPLERVHDPRTDEVFFMSKELIHPFLGFVQDPAAERISTRRGRTVGRTIDSQGFVRHSFTAGSGSDRLDVLIAGGSVALQFAAATGRHLAESLAVTSSGGRRLVTVRSIAMGGYKQPQQLFSLGWTSLVDGPPDVVINIDGFNDLVLGYTENLREGVFPFYPRGWLWRASVTQPISLQLAMGKAALLTEERARLAEAFQSSLASHSSLATWLWLTRDSRLANELVEAERQARSAVQRHSIEARSFATHGPLYDTQSMEAYIERAASVWQISSRQMAGICEGLGCEYFHFLQPNLHDPGSKPLSQSEQDLASGADVEVAALVRQGYPALSAAGAALQEAGVNFVDLRGALRKERESLYVDSCCHLSGRGYRILAAEVLAAVRRGPAQTSSRAGKAISEGVASGSSSDPLDVGGARGPSTENTRE